MSAVEETRAALERALESESDLELQLAVAVAQVYATLAVAEAIKDAVASTLYTGKP